MSGQEVVTLLAGGDLILGDLPLCIGIGIGTAIRKRGPDFLFEKIGPLLRSTDIVFANLETVLTDVGTRRFSYHAMQLKGTPRTAHALKEGGMTVLSIANNHILQHGKKAFQDTLTQLQRAGLQWTGLADEKNHCIPTLMTAKGLRIGFLGYSFRPEIFFKRQPLYAKGETAKIEEDIVALKKDVDAVVVSLHWGDEFIHRPSPSQKQIARRLVEAGATVILGHHPHVPQGIERYQGGLIAYSLGNFITDFWQMKLKKSFLLQCRLSKDRSPAYEIVPIIINERYQPELLSGEAREEVMTFVEELSEALSSSASSDGVALDPLYAGELHHAEEVFNDEIRDFVYSHLLHYPFWFTLQMFSHVLQKKVGRTFRKVGGRI